MLYRNIVVLIPDKALVYGNGSVYVEKSKKYIKDKKYNISKRVCVGKKINDEEMNPNDNYLELYPNISERKEPPALSDTLSVGFTAVVDKILDEQQTEIILRDVFNDEDYELMRDLIVYIVFNETTTIQHFPKLMRRMDVRSSVIRSDSYISTFFRENITDKKIELFLSAWNMLNRKKDMMYISYDSTNMNTHSNGIELAEYGHAKEDEDLPQVNLSYAINQSESLPLMYQLYPGSNNDNGQLKYMVDQLREYGYEDIGVVIDRGYYSKKNIDYLEKNGYSYLLMIKTNNVTIQKLIKENRYVLPNDRYFIEGHDVYGKTIKEKLFETDKRKSHIHLYFDSVKAANEAMMLSTTRIMYSRELEEHIAKHHKTEELKKYQKMFLLRSDEEGYIKSYKVREKYMQEMSDTFGFFSIVTSEEMDAKGALDVYRDRDAVEKLFESLKNEMDYKKFKVNTTRALKGKTFITFLSAIVRSRIYHQTKELRNKDNKEYTVPSIINELSNIEVTKNAKDKYVRRYALTAKQKNILNMFGLTEKDIDSITDKINRR